MVPILKTEVSVWCQWCKSFWLIPWFQHEIFLFFQGSRLRPNAHILRQVFETAQVIFMTILAWRFFSPWCWKQGGRKSVSVGYEHTETCRTRHSRSKSHLSTCEEKQLGAPDGPIQGWNSGTVGKGGVKFSGGVLQTRSPQSTPDSPQKSVETTAGAQHGVCFFLAFRQRMSVSSAAVCVWAHRCCNIRLVIRVSSLWCYLINKHLHWTKSCMLYLNCVKERHTKNSYWKERFVFLIS